MTSVHLFYLCLYDIVWSSGQSSWLQIQRSGSDSLRYQILWEVVGLERGSLSLVSTTEELLERKSGGPGLENQEYGRRDPSRWRKGTLYPQKLALTSPQASLMDSGHGVLFLVLPLSSQSVSQLVILTPWLNDWQIFLRRMFVFLNLCRRMSDSTSNHITFASFHALSKTSVMH
jgi:hypothetical protein